jgi:hypothetical protein
VGAVRPHQQFVVLVFAAMAICYAVVYTLVTVFT